MNFPFEKDIVLESDRALIRPMQSSDSNELLKVATEDEALLQYSPSQVHSPALLAQYVENALNDRANKIRYAFTIFDKHKNQYAGSTSFGNISDKDKRIEIGWTWIGREFQKTGLNRSCKHLLMDYVFNVLEFERLELRTDERNAVSRKAIEGIGGKLEGILRSHTLMSDGFRRNTACYSILRYECPIAKKKIHVQSTVTYTTKIQQFAKMGEKTNWMYIEVPADVADKINSGCKKSYRVKGKLDNFPIEKVALLPMGEGMFIMPFNAKMRVGMGKRNGATLQVSIELDERTIPINAELLECLADEPEALKFFNSLPKSVQGYFSKWIDTAKGESTKTKRIAESVNALLKHYNFTVMMRDRKARKLN
jgi:RimJ/RimL family protein N-acetyltransferase